MASDTNTKTQIVAAYVAIFLLARTLNLPMPDDLINLFESNVAIAILMFGSAWAATNDTYASCVGVFLYGVSLVLFHKRDKSKRNYKTNINDMKLIDKTNDLDSFFD